MGYLPPEIQVEMNAWVQSISDARTRAALLTRTDGPIAETSTIPTPTQRSTQNDDARCLECGTVIDAHTRVESDV